MYLQLLSAATATNGAPSGATAGVDRRTRNEASPCGIGEASLATILVKSTAGSGTMTCTLKLWGYSPVTAAWHPLGTNSTDSLRGVLNQGNAIGENATDSITHAELVQGLGVFTRFYLEVAAIGGTATAISAWLVAPGVRA